MGLVGTAGHRLASVGGDGHIWAHVFDLVIKQKHNNAILTFTGGRVHFLSVTNPEVCLFGSK